MFMLLYASLFAFQMHNVPVFNENAPHVIQFCVSKDFPSGALNPHFLKKLRDCFDLDVFIESGTNYGNTTDVASKIFKDVHTVEILPKLYLNAAKKFENSSNVHVYLGSSDRVFPKLIDQTEKKILFYLDGHFDGGESGRGAANTPILGELSAIRASGRTNSVILIDDIADFQDSLYPYSILGTCFEGYPDLKRLTDELLSINPDYQFCFPGNALLAFPPVSEVTVSPVASACAIDRLSEAQSIFSDELLLNSEIVIANASGIEANELLMYYQVYNEFECSYGWHSYSSFWHALRLKHEGNWHEADQLFRKAAKASLPNWRIVRYSS